MTCSWRPDAFVWIVTQIDLIPRFFPSPDPLDDAIVAALLRRSASASSEHPELGRERDRDHLNAGLTPRAS
jgi:uncharacterized membrane protein YkvA (DUF1232 family)